MKNEIKKPSVEWLFVEMLRAENKMQKLSHDEKIDLLHEAKEKHKKEMVMFVLNVMGNYKHGDVLFDLANKLYTETYEGVNQIDNKQNGVDEELIGWDENVKSFVKEKQMTKEIQKEFLDEYDSYLFRGGLDDVEWFYNEIYGGNK